MIPRTRQQEALRVNTGQSLRTRQGQRQGEAEGEAEAKPCQDWDKIGASSQVLCNVPVLCN